jgi:cyclic pyranopterin phosphate synthase
LTTALLKDSYGRAIRDLRVSVTDKCNFRCFYCLPHGSPPETAPKSSVLTYEEIEFAVSVFASLGVEKVRLTGGEPMLRRDIETLVAKLARVEGVKDLALTTNGYNLAERAASDSRPSRSTQSSCAATTKARSPTWLRLRASTRS